MGERERMVEELSRQRDIIRKLLHEWTEESAVLFCIGNHLSLDTYLRAPNAAWWEYGYDESSRLENAFTDYWLGNISKGRAQEISGLDNSQFNIQYSRWMQQGKRGGLKE